MNDTVLKQKIARFSYCAVPSEVGVCSGMSPNDKLLGLLKVDVQLRTRSIVP